MSCTCQTDIEDDTLTLDSNGDLQATPLRATPMPKEAMGGKQPGKACNKTTDDDGL
jgi:hypothetical protein